MQSRRPVSSPLRWLFPMMALGGLTTTLGPIAKWVGLAIFAPLVAGLWWRERSRSQARRYLRTQAEFEPLVIDEFRLSFDGFELLHGAEVRRRVAWADLCGIAAFIDFQPNGDVLMIGLRVSAGGKWITLAADVEGFDRLQLELQNRFGIPRGWEDAAWRGPRGLNWRALWGDARPPGETCWKCSYDLRGNASGACPECGTEFVWPRPAAPTPASTAPANTHQ